MIWSVSTLGMAIGNATASSCTKGSTSGPHELAYVGELAGDGRGGGHGRAHQVRARALALAAYEIAVGGGGAALARRHQFAVDADAHGAAGLAPFEPGALEDGIEPLRLRLRLDQARARHHQGRHDRAPATGDLGRGAQVLD